MRNEIGRANLMYLYAIKRTISEHLLSGLTKIEDVVGEIYHKFSKSEARNLMSDQRV